VNNLESYNHIRFGGTGFYEQKRGLIAVSGKEAVQFLDGMITNDVKTLEDGQQMLAAFPNAHGRLLGVARVLRQGDRFLIETEEATREKVFQNLFRFTFAGDFFVEDLSDEFRYFDIFGDLDTESWPSLTVRLLTQADDPQNSLPYEGGVAAALGGRGGSLTLIVANGNADKYIATLRSNGAVEIDDELYETLRIESGIPKYGVDMDETTIVPELGLDGLISYNKGCYIGQEIIARIHFRGHVAKQLTGLWSEPGAVATGVLQGSELTSHDGKSAGRITSVSYSPKLERKIVLGFVRWDYLAEGTELMVADHTATVRNLPFVA